MKERPILFSAPMVRAILEGRKTQTRRAVRKQFATDAEPAEVAATSPEGWQISGHSGLWWDDSGACIDDAIPCPYGIPGDRLWVRETFRIIGEGPSDKLSMFDRDEVQYFADRDERYIGPYHPSIHMPRRLSRILLEITNVRVEPLNYISDADVMAEGIRRYQFIPDDGFPICNGYTHKEDDGKCALHPSPIEAYAALWESINGHGSWGKHWVWVVEFKRVTP